MSDHAARQIKAGLCWGGFWIGLGLFLALG
jgi:hypothetical protein